MIRSLSRRAGLRMARLHRSNRGNVAVEFALVLPFLILLVSGVYDLGRAFTEKLKLDGAARAGVQYALYNHDKAEDKPGVIQSVRDDAEYSDGVLTITPVYYCTCLDATPIACGEGCAGGEVPLRYIQVDVSRSLDLMFDYPLITDPATIQGHAELRLR